MNRPPHISLVGAEPHARKIEAVKEVRRVANWELKQAKETVDAVLCGAGRTVPLVRDADAEAVSRRFASLGFVVEWDGRSVEPPEGQSYRPTWAEHQRGTVEVRALCDLDATGSLRVAARIVSGEADAGDRLGLPLNGSTIVVLPIERVTRSGDSLTIDAVADADDFEFWAGMNVIGEELPILRSGGGCL